jgi:hypothetical protein
VFTRATPLFSIVSHINSVHTTPSYGLTIKLRGLSPRANPTDRFTLILSSHLWLSLQVLNFLSGFPIKILYVFLFSPIPGTCLVVPFSLTPLFLSSDECKLSGSSLCNSLQSAITSSLFGPHIPWHFVERLSMKHSGGSLQTVTFSLSNFFFWRYYVLRGAVECFMQQISPFHIITVTELTTHPSLELSMSDPVTDHVHPRSFLSTHPFPGTERNMLYKQV